MSIGSLIASVHIQACCLEFLYFSKHLLEAGLRDLMDHPEEARVLPYLMSAFSDGHQLLLHTCLDLDATQQVYLIFS